VVIPLNQGPVEFPGLTMLFSPHGYDPLPRR
jgi:hypothetical protein